MQRQEVEAICANLPGAWPDTPWEDDLVYKIGEGAKGKIFCFLGGGPTERESASISIKVEPELTPVLHQQYEAVSSPAYLSKRHWIAIKLDGDMPGGEIEELIEDSHRLVAKGLSKRAQRELGYG